MTVDILYSSFVYQTDDQVIDTYTSFAYHSVN